MCRPSLCCPAVALCCLLLIACSDQSGPTGTDGLQIEFFAENQGAAPCQIKRVARIDQSLHSLYMVRGSGRYALDDGQTRDIPIQIQFRGMEGVVEDTKITLTDFEAPCSDVSIDWQIESCRDQDRALFDCPTVSVQGQEAFRALDLEVTEG